MTFTAVDASATTYSYTCTNSVQGPTNGITGELQLRLTGNANWTNTGTSATPKSGDVVQINSGGGATPCLGDLYLNQSGVLFENSNLSQDSSGDDINGMIEVAGAHVTLDWLNLTCATCSPTTSNSTGESTFTETGALVLHDGAVVLFENGQVNAGATSGMFVARSSALTVTNSLITGNGEGSGFSPADASGIFADGASSVRLGVPNGSGRVTIVANGASSSGYGVMLDGSSSLQSFTAAIGTPNQNSLGQISLSGGSSARLEDTAVAATTSSSFAIQATGDSSVVMEPNPENSGNSSVSTSTGGGILIAGASSAMVNNASITVSSTAEAAVEASASSTFIVAGGNTITNSATGGVAVQVDHSSSMIHLQGSHFGYTNAVETINGGGLVQEQSSMDLGQGIVSSNPSITWAPGSNGIQVQQNSSFRVSGGVSITGAVTITQGSNAFANTANGGSNAITSASCPFTTVPASHWAAPAKVSPAVSEATSFSSATSPQCLPF